MFPKTRTILSQEMWTNRYIVDPETVKNSIAFLQRMTTQELIQDTLTAYRNKSSDQEAFLSLTLAIYRKMNSAADFDDAIHNTIGRKAFADKLKSILNGNRQPTAECLRSVKLCGRIAESTMQHQKSHGGWSKRRSLSYPVLHSNPSRRRTKHNPRTKFVRKNQDSPLIPTNLTRLDLLYVALFDKYCSQIGPPHKSQRSDSLCSGDPLTTCQFIHAPNHKLTPSVSIFKIVTQITCAALILILL